MYDFEYLRPRSLAEATDLLAGADEARLLAGGMTLLPAMKLRLAAPQVLVDLAAVEELRDIRRDGDSLVIGAMVRHVDVCRSDLVRRHAPALARLAGGIGDVQVRNRGTIGGSLANNDPSADYPAACLALGARFRTSKRVLEAEDFFAGFFTTSLDEDEILVAVEFPRLLRGDYQKFRNQASGYAVVGVMVAATAQGVRVAVAGAGEDGVFRHRLAEEALAGHFDRQALRGVRMPIEGIMGDAGCSAEYRAHLVDVLTLRAVSAAIDGSAA